MDAGTFIKVLRDSGNKLLQSMADSLAGAIDKTSPESANVLGIGVDMPIKKKLERFLSSAIACVNHNGKQVLLSSSIPLLHHLEARRATKNRNKVVRFLGHSSKFDRILKSRNPGLVRTWNLIENKPYPIELESRWNILGWKLITADNIEMVGDSVNLVLEKGKLSK